MEHVFETKIQELKTQVLTEVARLAWEDRLQAGILDGDVVIVRRQPVAENGEIIIAMLDGEATCKRFYKEEGHFRLQPENDSYEPIYTDEMEVLGKVIASMRYYE